MFDPENPCWNTNSDLKICRADMVLDWEQSVQVCEASCLRAGLISTSVGSVNTIVYLLHNFSSNDGQTFRAPAILCPAWILPVIQPISEYTLSDCDHPGPWQMAGILNCPCHVDRAHCPGTSGESDSVLMHHCDAGPSNNRRGLWAYTPVPPTD